MPLLNSSRTWRRSYSSPGRVRRRWQKVSATILKAYGIKVTSFLGFLRHVLELDDIPDYATVVGRAFQAHITGHNYGADQIRFLRSVQEVFLQKRRLEEVDLYQPPLTQFGRNAVEHFFTPAQIEDLLTLTERLAT